MKLDFDQIPADGLNVQLADTSWLPSELDFEKPVFATASCWKQNSDNILVKGHYKVVLELACDRCLEEFRLPLNVEFSVYVEVQSAATQVREDDHHCTRAEMETFYVKKPVLDLSHLFRQQVLLAMPMKKLCSGDCQGLCDNCGLNLNLYKDRCQCKKEIDSPFKILARIKKVE